MPTTLQELFRHNDWATDQLLAACEELSDEQLAATAIGTMGTIGEMLVHVVAAQERYLAALTGEQPPALPREGDPFPGVASLRERSRASMGRLTEIAGNADWERIVRGVRRGEEFAMPEYIFLIQTIDHATEHRTHVRAILTGLGIEPPEIDAWHYLQEVVSQR